MRIVIGFVLACSLLPVQVADARPAKKPKVAQHKKAVAKIAKVEEAPQEKPAPPPPPPRETRAPVTQVVDSEDPAPRKPKH